MRIGLNIRGADGHWQRLSSELYELVNIEGKGELPHTNYKNGTWVRLISNNPTSNVVGYHSRADYVTVCRDGATTAEYLGFKREQVKRL